MELLIKGPLEQFIIKFDKETALDNAVFSVIPGEKQSLIESFLKGKTNGAFYVISGNQAAPFYVKNAFEDQGYIVSTPPAFTDILNKELKADYDQIISDKSKDSVVMY